MRRWYAVTFMIMALLVIAAPGASGKEGFGKESFIREGFSALFNGKDLSGWKAPEGDNGHWKVIDGVIDYDARSEAKGSKNLATEESFGDFALHIEWRLKRTTGLYQMLTILPDGSYKKDADGNVIKTPTPNADSGIFMRGTGKGQINIWCWPIGSGELWGYRNDKSMPPEVRAGAVPKVRADKPVGQWNAFDITMKGERLTVVLNGKTVIDNTRLPGIPASGPIVLQHHGGFNKKTGKMSPASSLIQFRNIWVKRLDSDKEGFVSLFNGKDLTGWITGPNNAWVVEDGVLTIKRPTDGREHNYDYLWTEKQYGDFVLDLEFKIPERANSGIFLRTSNLKDPVQTGIEVQVANSYGRKQLSRGGTAGAIYDCLAPTKNTIRKPGEWNRCIVTCDDNKIKVVLNGKQIIDMDLDKWTTVHKNPDGTPNKFTRSLKNFARKGYIGLQDHGRDVWYRNIRIKPLKKKAELAPLLTSSPPAAVYTLTDDPHGKILKGPDGQVVFRYMTKKPAETNLLANSVCCFHPLNTPRGERITDLAPGDHHHHRGVFLAWHTMDFREKADFTAFGPMGPAYGFNISRADFWGWGEFAPTAGRVIENRSVKLIKSDSEEAVLEISNDWLINKRVMADEKTLATVRKQDGVYIIDLDYRITPAIDMTLNHTAFGGFCVRARNDGKSYYATADGKVKLPDPHYSVPELNWPAKEWYDYTIAIDKGKTIGIAVLDHPDNPPATWHNPRYVWMVNPCIAADGPVQISKSKTLWLRYRLVVHDGPTPAKLLDELSSQWRLTSNASDFKLEPGFARLDNGKDLSGWTGDMRDWSVVNGAIHLHYQSPPSGGAVFSKKTHSKNAVVRLQFRAAYAADSGVFIHGAQFQVRDYPNSYPDTKRYAPFCRPAGQWNDMEFDITDGVAVVRLNGHVVSQAWGTGDRTGRGIGLQKEKGNFEYRFIRLKEKR